MDKHSNTNTRKQNTKVRAQFLVGCFLFLLNQKHKVTGKSQRLEWNFHFEMFLSKFVDILNFIGVYL